LAQDNVMQYTIAALRVIFEYARKYTKQMQVIIDKKSLYAKKKSRYLTKTSQHFAEISYVI